MERESFSEEELQLRNILDLDESPPRRRRRSRSRSVCSTLIEKRLLEAELCDVDEVLREITRSSYGRISGRTTPANRNRSLSPENDVLRAISRASLGRISGRTTPANRHRSLSPESVSRCRTPDETDGGVNSRPVLKTYTNRRKHRDGALIESFGLPDQPIFPVDVVKVEKEVEQVAEDLDVPCAGIDGNVNLVADEEELFEMHWKPNATSFTCSPLNKSFESISNKDTSGEEVTDTGQVKVANNLDGATKKEVSRNKKKSFEKNLDAIRRSKSLDDAVVRHGKKIIEKRRTKEDATKNVEKKSKRRTKDVSLSKKDASVKEVTKNIDNSKSSRRKSKETKLDSIKDVGKRKTKDTNKEETDKKDVITIVINECTNDNENKVIVVESSNKKKLKSSKKDDDNAVSVSTDKEDIKSANKKKEKDTKRSSSSEKPKDKKKESTKKGARSRSKTDIKEVKNVEEKLPKDMSETVVKVVPVKEYSRLSRRESRSHSRDKPKSSKTRSKKQIEKDTDSLSDRMIVANPEPPVSPRRLRASVRRPSILTKEPDDVLPVDEPEPEPEPKEIAPTRKLRSWIYRCKDPSEEKVTVKNSSLLDEMIAPTKLDEEPNEKNVSAIDEIIFDTLSSMHSDPILDDVVADKISELDILKIKEEPIDSFLMLEDVQINNETSLTLVESVFEVSHEEVIVEASVVHQDTLEETPLKDTSDLLEMLSSENIADAPKPQEKHRKSRSSSSSHRRSRTDKHRQSKSNDEKSKSKKDNKHRSQSSQIKSEEKAEDDKPKSSSSHRSRRDKHLQNERTKSSSSSRRSKHQSSSGIKITEVKSNDDNSKVPQIKQEKIDTVSNHEDSDVTNKDKKSKSSKKDKTEVKETSTIEKRKSSSSRRSKKDKEVEKVLAEMKSENMVNDGFFVPFETVTSKLRSYRHYRSKRKSENVNRKESLDVLLGEPKSTDPADIDLAEINEKLRSQQLERELTAGEVTQDETTPIRQLISLKTEPPDVDEEVAAGFAFVEHSTPKPAVKIGKRRRSSNVQRSRRNKQLVSLKVEPAEEVQFKSPNSEPYVRLMLSDGIVQAKTNSEASISEEKPTVTKSINNRRSSSTQRSRRSKRIDSLSNEEVSNKEVSRVNLRPQRIKREVSNTSEDLNVETESSLEVGSIELSNKSEHVTDKLLARKRTRRTKKEKEVSDNLQEDNLEDSFVSKLRSRTKAEIKIFDSPKDVVEPGAQEPASIEQTPETVVVETLNLEVLTSVDDGKEEVCNTSTPEVQVEDNKQVERPEKQMRACHLSLIEEKSAEVEISKSVKRRRSSSMPAVLEEQQPPVLEEQPPMDGCVIYQAGRRRRGRKVRFVNRVRVVNSVDIVGKASSVENILSEEDAVQVRKPVETKAALKSVVMPVVWLTRNGDIDEACLKKANFNDTDIHVVPAEMPEEQKTSRQASPNKKGSEKTIQFEDNASKDVVQLSSPEKSKHSHSKMQVECEVVKSVPVESPVASPMKSPVVSPIKSPVVSRMRLPAVTPMKSPSVTPVRSPSVTPVRSPVASRMKSPTKSPVVSRTKSPVIVPMKSPIKSPIVTPMKSPIVTPMKSPIVSPKKSSIKSVASKKWMKESVQDKKIYVDDAKETSFLAESRTKSQMLDNVQMNESTPVLTNEDSSMQVSVVSDDSEPMTRRRKRRRVAPNLDIYDYELDNNELSPVILEEPRTSGRKSSKRRKVSTSPKRPATPVIAQPPKRKTTKKETAPKPPKVQKPKTRGRKKKAKNARLSSIVQPAELPEYRFLEYVPGDLAWARLGSYPYWPCMIYVEPKSNNFKTTSAGNRKLIRYHLRFFGDNGRRSWVSSIRLMPYVGKDDLDKCALITKQDLGYIIKPSYLRSWNIAVNEAESLKLCTLEERFDFFRRMFPPTKTELKQLQKKRKADEMLESESINEGKSPKRFAKEKIEPPVVSSPKSPKKEKPKKEPAKKEPVKKEPVKKKPVVKKESTKKGPTKKELAKATKPTPLPTLAKTSPKHVGKSKKNTSKTTPLESPVVPKVVEKTKQIVETPKRPVPPPIAAQLSEPLSEQSDSDTLSKSSANAPVSDKFKSQLLRYRRYNIFRGVLKERVCQICCKPGEVFRCRGPCNGIFHLNCAAKLEEPKQREQLEQLQDEIEEEEEEEECIKQEVVDATSTKPQLEYGDGSLGNLANCTKDEQLSSYVKIESEDVPEYSIPSVSMPGCVEIIEMDSDSDCEYVGLLKPSVSNLSRSAFKRLSLADKIDLKMEEIMMNIRGAKDDSLEEDDENRSKTGEELEIRHVTADGISFGSPVTGKMKNRKDKRKKGPFDDLSIASEMDVGESSINCLQDDQKYFKCYYCSESVDTPCFVCHKTVSDKEDSHLQKCSLLKCGKMFHLGCLRLWPQTQWSLQTTAKQKETQLLDVFVCPRHQCHTCCSDNPRAASSRCSSDQIVRCLRCPATYHMSSYCVPAGTEIYSTSQIVCPRHFYKSRSLSNPHRVINTPWCFLCSNGGELICCETCPTSVHAECLQLNLLEDGTFVCEDCESGRMPLYDEVVWVKMGAYRWWPALILFPGEVPDNVRLWTHRRGEFVVKFFGTHDHYWVNKGRVFLFQEGDKGQSTKLKNRVDILFNVAVEEAITAHQLKKIFKSTQVAEIKSGLKPPHYIKVKINKPVGNVRQVDCNLSNTTPCECDPNHTDPCGPKSYCLNRLLLTECDPNVCPAKERCNNQNFEKRRYPPLVPYKTDSKGWGLKSLMPIRKGDFVIEYVGELIDEQEMQRRIQRMSQQKDENYYFLTIDKDRVIDAGPKGNLSRFMNHCCQPNCETQKWTVNGDTRVGLFALEDIAPHEELTFNYNLECVDKEMKICKCGAPNCSGFIGVKVKQEDSLRKSKKNGNGNGVKKKKQTLTTQVLKYDGPCFVCGISGNVGACHNKICTKYYHLECVNLDIWPEGKWVCPWHNCNTCSKRTIRCCIKCINSYCPNHSEGNIRYDKLLGFVCSEHDPSRESQVIQSRNLTEKQTSKPTRSTEETDVTSTTSDEHETSPHKGTDPQSVEDKPSADPNTVGSHVTSTPIVNDNKGKPASTADKKKKRGKRKRSKAKVVVPASTCDTPKSGSESSSSVVVAELMDVLQRDIKKVSTRAVKIADGEELNVQV